MVNMNDFGLGTQSSKSYEQFRVVDDIDNSKS